MQRFYVPAILGLLISLPLSAATMKEAFNRVLAQEAPRADAQQRKFDAAMQHAQALTPEPLSLTISGRSNLGDQQLSFREYEAELGIPLWQWGQRERQQQLVQHSAAVDMAQLHVQRWQLAGQLREAVWATNLAQLNLAASQQKIDVLQAMIRDLSRRLKAGDVAPLDLTLVQTALLQAQIEQQQLQAQLDESRLAYQSIMGEPTASLPDEIELIPADLSARHPQLQQLDSQLQLSHTRLLQANTDTRDVPELGLTFTRERGGAEESYQNLGKLALKIPFGSEGRTQARVSSVNAELIDVQLSQEREQRQLEAQRQAAQLSLQQTRASRDLLAQRRALTQQAFDWQQRSYRAGQMPLAVFLVAQIDAIDSAFALQRAELEIRRATSRYLQTLGVLP